MNSSIDSLDIEYEEYEPILDQRNRRFTLFPITYPTLWDLYKKQLASFWKAEEVDFSKDREDFDTLSENEQHYIKRILGFFAASDGIVNFNLGTRFLNELVPMEASVCYTYQMMMENIHSESYSIMLDNLVKHSDERMTLFNSIKTVESIKTISDWAFKWIESDLPFSYRVIAFCVVEGVFFSGAFASIFWLKRFKSNGRLFLSGLIKSNEFISRDEGQHVQFGVEIYKLLKNKLSTKQVYRIIEEGVEISRKFYSDALPVRLLGINEESMMDYIMYVSDRLLVELGYEKKYNKQNPFPFMETIGMQSKTNFFESRPTEYQSAHVLGDKENKNEILEDDF
jgi:ribonucleotide reductase beta subunit family protein with ferritin-like domain